VTRRLHASEHDAEPQPGLPERLPVGERLLWQGAPDWRLLARNGFHWRKFALYFALLIGWRVFGLLADGAGFVTVATALAWMVPLAAAALGFIVLLAWLVGRTTLYTLTERRLVLRIGIVLSVTFNLPLRRIDAARLRDRNDGSGDIALQLSTQDRIGFLHLWPHVRPWRLARAEPMLRALPQAQAVAALIGDALIRSLEPDKRAAVIATRDEAPSRSAVRPHLPHAA
jgi:hypothetical protein